MKKLTRKRSASVLAVAAVLAGIMTAGTGTASAATTAAVPNVTFSTSKDGPSGKGSATTLVLVNNVTAGQGAWIADGDSLEAYDHRADGLHISSYLSTGRSVTTKGHSAPYRAKKGGNLPEGKKYTFWVCIADGTKWQRCSPTYDVHA
ncbi:hypothetical protein ACH4OH_27135 [Streptomyces albidoflavus]